MAIHPASIGLDKNQKILEEAREKTALSLNAHPTEIIFTVAARKQITCLFGIARQYGSNLAINLISAIEHHAIQHAAEELTSMGFSVIQVLLR